MEDLPSTSSAIGRSDPAQSTLGNSGEGKHEIASSPAHSTDTTQQLLSAFNFDVKNPTGGVFIKTVDSHEEKRGKHKKKRVETSSQSSTRSSSSSDDDTYRRRKRKYGDYVSDSLDHHRRRMSLKKRHPNRRAKSHGRTSTSGSSPSPSEIRRCPHRLNHASNNAMSPHVPMCSCMVVPLCRVFCQSCGLAQFQTCSSNPSTSTADYSIMNDGFARLCVNTDANRATVSCLDSTSQTVRGSRKSDNPCHQRTQTTRVRRDRSRRAKPQTSKKFVNKKMNTTSTKKSTSKPTILEPRFNYNLRSHSSQGNK